MKKLLLTFIILLTGLSVQAVPSSIDAAISESGINKDAVSISVKNASDGKTLYEHKENTPIPPASTLKTVTAAVAADTLGNNYEFKTQLYKTSDNVLYLKLAADPLFNKGNLETLMKEAKSKNILEPKMFYIDDYVIDGVSGILFAQKKIKSYFCGR